MGKVFIDTNIIVYSLDGRTPAKRDHVRAALDAVPDDAGVISTQVLQETYSVLTRKLGMTPLEAKQSVRLLDVFETVTVTPPLVFQAIDCSLLNTLSIWDSLILAAAASANCEMLWTEDLNPGQTVLGVRIENPLADLVDAPGDDS